MSVVVGRPVAIMNDPKERLEQPARYTSVVSETIKSSAKSKTTNGLRVDKSDIGSRPSSVLYHYDSPKSPSLFAFCSLRDGFDPVPVLLHRIPHTYYLEVANNFDPHTLSLFSKQ